MTAWCLARKIRRHHRELSKYIRRSAYEIAAWKQDIGFLDEQLRYHRAASDSWFLPKAKMSSRSS
jgi:hypothetical protein